ncbi:MAG: SPOR domain-containing protein, partial [Gammaproteobacteria bacterium]|nr:SPOR domain-containing protein [Gammaproteobacteria bacterium]
MILRIFIFALLLTSSNLFAATSKFLNVESFVNRPGDSDNIKSYAVNILSFTKPINLEDIKNISVLDKDFLYVNKVSVNDVVYYRLISGNFATLKQAKKHLSRVKKH